MLLKKPYAFLIKHFKLINFILFIFSAYLLFKSNYILKFLNNYLVQNGNVVGTSLKSDLFNYLMFILPILIIIVSCFLLWLMIKKRKPYKFYLINFFVYLFFFFVLIYSYGFIDRMESQIVDVLGVRVLRDIFVIFISFEGVLSIFLLIRFLGFDIKKFDFMSDLNNMQLSEDDKDEIEIEFNVDSNERKRKINKKLSDLKYSLKENNSIVILFVIIVIIVLIFFVYNNLNIYFFNYKEDELLKTDYYSYKVDNSYLVNTNYKGIKISDNYLVIVDLYIKKNSFENKILLNSFKLKIGDNLYSVTGKYNKSFIDLGNIYINEELTNDYKNYLLVYEIPTEEIDNDMKLLYFENGNSVKVVLKPVKFVKSIKEFNLGDEVAIDDNDIIKVNSFDINDNFAINYDYCLKDNCYNSVQHLVPTLNTNYDKVIIKINGEFKKKDNSKYSNFSNVLSSIGSVEYKIGDNIYTSNMTRITNLKKKEDNIYYYEVNKEILISDSIKLNFNTRKCKYSFILR